jgi:hypothetical protein
VSSAADPDEVKVDPPPAVDGTADDVTLVDSSEEPASEALDGSVDGHAYTTEAKSDSGGTPPLGTPKPKDEPVSPWSSSSEPSGSLYGDGAGSSASPYASPSQGAGGSVAGAFKERVNDVMRPGKSAAGKSPRKAHLQVSRLEPWSVMKFSFVMSLVCFVVLLVAVAVIYMILSGLGVFDQIVQTINELTQDKNAAKTSSSFDAASWFSFTRIFGYAALVGALNVLLITALATVWSVIYNIAADFVGGIEVTLKEAE